jgi:hypothetical protein
MNEDTQPPVSAPKSGQLHAEPRPRAVTWRSFLVGLIGVLFICGLTPYNDYAVANTYLVGNFLPIGLVLFLMVTILLVNAPLRKFAPKAALREGELAVVTAMLLVACAIPSSGLMRYLPTSIVGLYNEAAERPDYAATIAEAGVPRWLLPESTGTTPDQIGNSDTFKYFRTRSPDGSVPWAAWIKPLLVWGVLVGLMWTLLVLLSVLVRRQWAENEKLAFPLATVYSALIESPEPDRMVNSLFRSRGFWLAAGAVMLVHSMNGLHAYFAAVPEIPLGYNFWELFVDAPWNQTTYGFKNAQVFFCIVGIAFFLQTKVAFSLWAFFILLQIVHMVLGGMQVSFTDTMKHDQTFGGLVVMTGVILWIGRQHWWMIIRHMFGRARPDETESRYLPYAFAGWATVACFFAIVGWFVMVGMSVWGAIVLTLVLVMLFMMVARVVAETGLVFVQVNWLMYRIWYYPVLLAPTPMKIGTTDFFFTGWMTTLFHDLRESFAAFFQQGVRVADEAAYERSHRWKTSVSFIVVIFIALGVGYVTAAGSMLWTEYNYFSTMASIPTSPINDYGIANAPRSYTLDPARSYEAGLVQESGAITGLNMGIGGAIVAVTSILRLTLAWWPLHPIAFIVLYSYATQKLWFSILLGWMAKVILVRMGGSSLLKAAKPVFIGLVVGEASAAGIWLVTSLVVNWMGYEYKQIFLLPG